MSYAADTLAIVGLGLIGGSLARALRENGFSRRFIGCGHRRASLQRGVELGVIDSYTLDVDEALAQASGIDPRREGLLLTLALALVVAVAVKIVGALLIAALLIIPAAAARGPARSPEAMAALAVLAGAFSVLGGLWLSLRLDTPAGPSIVAAAAAIFALSLIPRRSG